MNWLATTHIAIGEQLQEYINQFKLNIVCAKYNKIKDAATLISYFSTGIPIRIMQRVQAMDNVPTTITGWYKKAAHFHPQREIARKIALMHRGLTSQNTHPNFTHRPQTLRPAHNPNTMDINALNLSPVERSRCLQIRLCFICKQPNCSTRCYNLLFPFSLSHLLCLTCPLLATVKSTLSPLHHVTSSPHHPTT